MKNRYFSFGVLGAVGSLALAFWSANVHAEMATRPLLGVAGSAPPNIMFTLDDSGSMMFECIPDSLCIDWTNDHTYSIGTVPGGFGTGDVDYLKNAVATYDKVTTTTTNGRCISYYWWGGCRDYEQITTTTPAPQLYGRRMRTASINPLYYSPAVRYQPWLKADGTRYTAYAGTAAPVTPGATGTGNVFNLATAQSYTTSWCTSVSSCANGTQSVVLAQYFTVTSGTGTSTSDFTQTIIQSGSTYPKGAAREDCVASAGVCTYAEELQNFSNWFTYARSRIRVAIGGTAEAFYALPAEYRVGYGRINNDTATSRDGVSTKTIERGVRPFTTASGSTAKTDFYTWLFARTLPSGGTPLRRAMGDVGEYYTRTDNAGPWGAVPGSTDSTAHLSCRRSFHVLMTDGQWNGDAASASGAAGNVDGTNGSAITGPNSQSYTYTAARPYSDSYSGTLADVAMYYWSRDLRSDLVNGVSASTANPAFWQHMVNHTIAFGVSGALSNPGDLAALTSGSKSWGDPSNSTNALVDDLWHAALNSRGTQTSARNATEYAAALRSVFSEIAAVPGSEAGVAVSSRSLSSDSVKYVPKYDTGLWSGDLVAVNIPTTANGSETTAWSAVANLPAPASRNIFTYNREATGTKGVAFTWTTLSDTMKTAVFGATTGGEGLVSYLRGDRTGETSGLYRRRASAMGDIVNSTPVLVKDQFDGQYNFLPAATAGKSTYLRYLQLKKNNRQAQVFVGANDGMLHAFNASTGVESFAFMPSAVLSSVKNLASTSYSHQYFVDGPLVETDVYDSANGRWRNLVVGGGGAGAKNLMAINVPIPALPTTGSASTLTAAQSAPGASDILWEIDNTTTDFSELGYVLQTPESGYLRNGSWAIVVGNGYESASGTAQLFIINALTGALIKRIDTGVGSTASRNGLSGVRLVRDSYQRVVAAYAGDLRGNVWKFDLSAEASSSWAVAFGGNPLYTLVNTASQDGVPRAEPITTAPTFVLHPLGGVQLLVGSGKLFETADPEVNEQRALYGLWDTVAVGSASTDATKRITDSATIVGQTVTATPISGTTNGTYYTVSSNSVDYANKRGWRLPLTIAAGQRVTYDPQIGGGRVFFETLVPSGGVQSCTVANINRYGFLLDPFMGAPGEGGPTFDTNGDGAFTAADSSTAGAVKLGRGGGATVVSTGSDGLRIVSSGSVLGDTSSDQDGRRVLKTPLRYWRQIINPPI